MAVVVVMAVLAVLTVVAPAQAAVGRVRGTIVGARGEGAPELVVAWFTEDWQYVDARRVSGGGYSLLLEPGTYHLQFTDRRPTYDVDRYAPADVTVTVTEGATAVADVRLHRGAAIGGTVLAHGKVAPGARVVAANQDRNSFETTADKTGAFALGGLPPGNYSVFTYDKARAWVGVSTYVRKLKGGVFRPVRIDLDQRAGELVVDLYAGGQPYPGTAYVTAVSRKSGQFWTEKVSYGTVTFRGLYRGGYDLVVPDAGGYQGGTLPVSGVVKGGRTAFGSVTLTQPAPA